MIPAKLQQAIDETEQIEAGNPVRADTTISRPGISRSKTLQIRLSEDEFQLLTNAAGEQPTSAFARHILLSFLHLDAEEKEQRALVHALHTALGQAGYSLTRDSAA
ncbi:MULTISPECIES: hypothetical protein [unclassified Corynebacterium]|uniref:hypothetical protein n=1 Tax=unclassified Corynebacterium TaxID=2624378 RepID=UPI0029CA0149|nr:MULTISPECIES: hypothetical protein [unclassified Corynebacterium]WPF66198.1 hypothetical protein OLX12_00230 [Corynebacterium sp. 22KM0430]WPF68689.1 hypothetical protein OLW90_00230 [Corynebacterium sp. 21KM1197]